jgi:hypothetical protein
MEVAAVIRRSFARSAQSQPRVLYCVIGERTKPAPFVAFDQRHREPGYLEGHNLVVEFIGLEGPYRTHGQGDARTGQAQGNVMVAFGPQVAMTMQGLSRKCRPIIAAH